MLRGVELDRGKATWTDGRRSDLSSESKESGVEAALPYVALASGCNHRASSRATRETTLAVRSPSYLLEDWVGETKVASSSVMG